MVSSVIFREMWNSETAFECREFLGLFLKSWPLALTPYLKFGEPIASECSYSCGHRRGHSLLALPSNRISGTWEQSNYGLKWDDATAFENLYVHWDTWVTQWLSICLGFGAWSQGPEMESHIRLPIESLFLPLPMSLPFSLCLSLMNK